MRTSAVYTLVYSLIKLFLIAVWFIIFISTLSVNFLITVISIYTKKSVEYLERLGKSIETLNQYKTLVVFDYIAIGVGIIFGIYFMWTL